MAVLLYIPNSCNTRMYLKLQVDLTHQIIRSDIDTVGLKLMKIQHIFCLPRSYSMNTNTQVCFSLDDDDMHAISDPSSVKGAL